MMIKFACGPTNTYSRTKQTRVLKHCNFLGKINLRLKYKLLYAFTYYILSMIIDSSVLLNQKLIPESGSIPSAQAEFLHFYANTAKLKWLQPVLLITPGNRILVNKCLTLRPNLMNLLGENFAALFTKSAAQFRVFFICNEKTLEVKSRTLR